MISYFHRHLEPAESLAEILFGLIMVLTCTLGAAVIGGTDREAARGLLLAALGCNVAWGVIDAALYVMGTVFQRNRSARLMRAIEEAPNETAALDLVKQSLESRLERLGGAEDRDRLYRNIRGLVSQSDSSRTRVSVEDLHGAFAVFLLVVGTALPAAVPFLFFSDPMTALRVSNLILLSLLFVVGFHWAGYVGANKWVTGLAMLLSGVALVGIAIPLGG